MCPERDFTVFSIKTPTQLPPAKWREHLDTVGITDAGVRSLGKSLVDGEAIVEVRIDGKGVKMTQEVRRSTEAKLRRVMGGQVLQN